MKFQRSCEENMWSIDTIQWKRYNHVLSEHFSIIKKIFCCGPEDQKGNTEEKNREDEIIHKTEKIRFIN